MERCEEDATCLSTTFIANDLFIYSDGDWTFCIHTYIAIYAANRGLDNRSAGLLATINYLGYLIGAMVPIWIVMFSKVTDLKIYL